MIINNLGTSFIFCFFGLAFSGGFYDRCLTFPFQGQARCLPYLLKQLTNEPSGLGNGFEKIK